MRRRYLLFLSLLMVPLLAACSGLPKGVVTASNVTVMVSPSTITLGTFVQQPFTATVTGSTNTAVVWEVDGIPVGTPITGTISSAGLFSAPHFISSSLIPANNAAITVTIKAISQADLTASGTATITLVPLQQNSQSGAIELGTSGGNVNASSPQPGGKIECCGGTLGSLLSRNGSFFILSNNHVMANSDAGAINDGIIQPALIDTGTCTSGGATTVANLSQFFTLEGSPANPVDAAISQIVSGKVNTSGTILMLGATADANGVPVAGSPHAGSGLAASLGDSVAKSGRSSGLTCSTVISLSDAFSVQYQKGCGTGTNFTVNYTNQIDVLGGEFSTEGDSGSLIVEQATADPVALLFAGSDVDTVANPIGDVLLAMADSSNHVPTVVGGAAHAVIGCTLPGPSGAKSLQPDAVVSSDLKQAAVAARDTHAKELLGIPGVRGVGVGASLDHSGQAALLLFVAPGTSHNSLPAQVDGIRTRIVETAGETSGKGILSEQESATLAPQQVAFAVNGLSAAEMTRAKTVHSARVYDWMKQPGVQGFGITSSADSSGEAALMIYLVRGVVHGTIPAVIDGVRTRVRESSRIHAGWSHSPARPGCSVPAPKTVETRVAAALPASN